MGAFIDSRAHSTFAPLFLSTSNSSFVLWVDLGDRLCVLGKSRVTTRHAAFFKDMGWDPGGDVAKCRCVVSSVGLEDFLSSTGFARKPDVVVVRPIVHDNSGGLRDKARGASPLPLFSYFWASDWLSCRGSERGVVVRPRVPARALDRKGAHHESQFRKSIE